MRYFTDKKTTQPTDAKVKEQVSVLEKYNLTDEQMKVIQVNCTILTGSTGRIVYDLGEVIKSRGYECAFLCGYKNKQYDGNNIEYTEFLPADIADKKNRLKNEIDRVISKQQSFDDISEVENEEENDVNDIAQLFNTPYQKRNQVLTPNLNGRLLSTKKLLLIIAIFLSYSFLALFLSLKK